MSLRAKDIILSLLVVLASGTAMYAQYFAPISLHQNAMYLWASTAITFLLFLRFSGPGNNFVAYSKAAKLELKKVVWPPRDDVISATVAVGIAVVIFSVLVSLLDAMLVKLLSYIIG
jgi:preprotein translocase subunit SecE